MNDCAGTKSHKHCFETPFSNKHLERCKHCGIWQIHTEEHIVYLPPPEVLVCARRVFKIDPKDAGQLLEFKRAEQTIRGEPSGFEAKAVRNGC